MSTSIDTVVNVREAAQLLDVHENTVRRWVATGILTDASRPGRPLSIPRHQIQAMLDQDAPLADSAAAYRRGERDGRAAAIREIRAFVSQMRLTTTSNERTES
jgi:excisionase family DNA binding protein